MARFFPFFDLAQDELKRNRLRQNLGL